VLPEQRRDTHALMRKAGINVRPQDVAAHSEPVKALVGEVAPYKAPSRQPNPVAKSAAPKTGGGPRRRRAGGGGGGNPSSPRAQHRNHSGRRRAVSG
jgi:hypothetical protein